MKGALYLVGTGPGDLSLLPDMARRAIEASEVVIGYALYLDLIRPLLDGKEILEGVMTKEEDRVALALEKCRQGKQVALVSSGDIGIYGLASLAFELLQKEEADIDVWIVPGISALNAASALLGAPLNHDFCAISLSDLLTPWPLIERRIEAAGAEDFNVVFYNPKSERRDWQLGRAAEILRRYRSDQTPVGIVGNAFRKDQKVRMLTLKDLPQASVDMLSTVVVGSSTTRKWKNWIFTPRGYCRKVPGTELQTSPVIRYQVPSCAPDAIIDRSFQIIQKELGPHSFAPEELAVVMRVIHATGDFAFASLLRFQNGFFDAIVEALQEGQTIVTDVQMTKSGISTTLLKGFSSPVACYVGDPDVADEAAKRHSTKSACAMRKAVASHPHGIYVIGNAPTALLELLSLVEEQEARPSAVIGVPVGFISAVESKEALLKTHLPACTVVGRRGGSPVAGTAMNACLKLAHAKIRS